MEPFDLVTETSTPAQHGVIELAEDEESALEEWDDPDGPVQVDDGRVALLCESRSSDPVIVLRSFEREPEARDGAEESGVVLATVGVWSVPFRSGQVEIWSLFDGPSEQVLRLPPSSGGFYRVRVSRGVVDTGGQELRDYEDDLHEAGTTVPNGLERVEVDFWPL